MTLATPQEACREFARNVGVDRPTQAWILTGFDTWERNPFYTGPAVPHPEDDYGYDEALPDAPGATFDAVLEHQDPDHIPF